jgi:hypothetical protein
VGGIIEDRGRQEAAQKRASSVELYLAALRVALDRYAFTGDPSTLDQAFAAAAAAIAVLRGHRANERCGATEARTMMSMLPELDRLASVAVREAERSLHARACALWERLGLRSPAPTWYEIERSEARVLIVAACAPLDGRSPMRLGSGLIALASQRWAALLAAQLRAGDEELWRAALADRYPAVRRRYAPRTKWRTHGLSEGVASDRPLAQALHSRLSRWLADGLDFSRFPAELEAAFAHAHPGPRGLRAAAASPDRGRRPRHRHVQAADS